MGKISKGTVGPCVEVPAPAPAPPACSGPADAYLFEVTLMMEAEKYAFYLCPGPRISVLRTTAPLNEHTYGASIQSMSRWRDVGLQVAIQVSVIPVGWR